jgi:hypothetical protein
MGFTDLLPLLRMWNPFARCFNPSISCDPDFVFPKIPDEILYNIFSYLGPKDLVSCSGVNKLFHQISNDDLLWKKVYCSVLPHFPKSAIQGKTTYRQSFAKDFPTFKITEYNILKERYAFVPNISKWTCQKAQIVEDRFYAIHHQDSLVGGPLLVKGTLAARDLSIIYTHSSTIHALVAQGKYVYMASSEGGIHQWDAVSKEVRLVFNTGSEIIRSMVISDGYLYAGSNRNSLFKWNLKTEEECYKFTGQSNEIITKIAVHDRKLFAIGSNQQNYREIDQKQPMGWTEHSLGKSHACDMVIYKNHLLMALCNGHIQAIPINGSDLPFTLKIFEVFKSNPKLRVYRHFLFVHVNQSDVILVWNLETRKFLYTLAEWTFNEILDIQIADGELYVCKTNGVDCISF